MQPKPITQYALYYSYCNVPFDNCDADWSHLGDFDTLNEAHIYLFNVKEYDRKYHGIVTAYYTILEEVTERKIVYSEVENESVA